MKIYLIRHGETTGDIEDRYGGDYDDHLTDKGRQQARELAEKLKDKKIQIIFHSPRIRAIETAEIVNKILNIKIEVIDAFRERNKYGILTGMIKSEAKEKYPKEVKELSKGIYNNVKSSEDYVSFKERAIRAFKKVIDSHYETIAIITHSEPIKCIAREILRLGEIGSLKDCEVLEIQKEDNKFSLRR